MTKAHLKARERTLFRWLFVAAALWNLAGGIIGYFNPEVAFELLFDRALTDPLYRDIYRGACGTTLVYFVGYSVVALDPARHFGVVLVGGIGKVGFAFSLLRFHLAGLANENALVVIVGDALFSLLFAYYFYRLARTRGSTGAQATSARSAESATGLV